MASPSPPLSRGISPDFTDPDDSENDEGPAASPTSWSVRESAPATTTPPSMRTPIPQVHAGNSPISNYCKPHPSDTHVHVHKLQDYEEQMRILAAQNKRRLMMAREEQDRLAFKSTHSLTPTEKEGAATQALLMAKDSLARRQQALTNFMRQEASSRKTQQRVQSQQYAMNQGLKTNTEPPNANVLENFDFDSFLPSPRPTEPSHPDTSCGPNHSAPCNAAAANLLGSTLSNEELSQIEKNRRASIESVARQHQLMLKQRMMAQGPHTPPMMGTGRNFFYYPMPVPTQHDHTIYPQVPHHVSAQTAASNTQGPPLYHTFQGVGHRIFNHPYPSPAAVDEPALPTPPAKRGPSFDFSSREQEPALKKSKATVDLNDSNNFGGKTSNLRHPRSSSVESDESGIIDTDDEPGMAASAPKPESDVSSLIEAMKKRVAKEKDPQPTEQPVEKQTTQVHVPVEEIAYASPAHSSATLDDEDRSRSPLNELQLDTDMEIDQENASEIKRTEFDSGISVTTTTFKDGKTMTVMCVGDGSSSGKSKVRRMRQGVEIVTKTVVISGVVTTTTTTALIPMSGIGAGNEEEVEEEE